jgi:protein-L-isoaspartate O-methyltransferase
MLVLVVGLMVLIGFVVGGLLGAPWVPARKRDVAKMLDDTNLKKNELYIELGSGDGRLVAAAAHRGAKAIGYEVNPVMWAVSVLRTLRYPNAHIKLANFWGRDLAEADVVMVFLMPKFMKRLEAKLEKELKPGARMVSYSFKLPQKSPALSRTSWFIYKY